MKFKVGDKVRVRSDLVVDKWYGDCRFTNGMGTFKGKVVTIALIFEDLNMYRIEKSQFYWTDEMLEPVEPVKETFNVGDVVYNKDGCKAKIVDISFLIEYEKSGARFYKAKNEITKTKPLKKITKEQLKEMGYELE